jgi:ribonuclease D
MTADSRPYDLIETDDALSRLVSGLERSGVQRLAVDIEGENNLHSYGIHVALIQLFDGSRGFLVDALAIRDRRLLKALMEESRWVKVWFDAANDLLSFQHALAIRPGPIQDISIAARLLGMKGGLQQIAQKGGSASAKDRFQKSNWLRRPFSRGMLDYAFSDVLYLLDLADRLSAELARKGFSEEFEKRNTLAQEMERSWNPLANYPRIPGYNRLPGPAQRLAKILWYAREYYARQYDLPPANVASKLEMRSILDRNLRDPGAMTELLNRGRKRNVIHGSDFIARFADARKDIEAEEAESKDSRARR